eukprot:1922280-Rhodomonas_salina.2
MTWICNSQAGTDPERAGTRLWIVAFGTTNTLCGRRAVAPGTDVSTRALYQEERKLTLERLVDMEPIEVSGILRQNRSGLLIQQYVGQFPYLDVQVRPASAVELRA